MEMPRPGPAHQRLQRFLGHWEGAETLSPTPWGPGGQAHGRTHYRMALGGISLFQDYRQIREGSTGFEGHGVMLIEPDTQDVLWWWFDSMGFPAEAARGTWNGDTLQFEKSTPMGDSRYRYVFHGDGRYVFTIDMRPPGQVDFSEFMRGDYTRTE